MTVALPPEAVRRFRAIIARGIGLQFDDAKLGFLGEVLKRRSAALRSEIDAYLAGLEKSLVKPEIGAIARELTVPETYFFRYSDQFRAFTEVCLPERMRARGENRSLRLLSAGCASGEEAYTLAILAREHVTDPSWDVRIAGIDVNPSALEQATRARFSSWAFRETTPEVIRRWFRMEGREALLDESVRASVKFEERNLVEDDASFWQPETHDVVFCRNVLMYLTPACATAVMDRITRTLAPGGYLFLGHAETLRGLSTAFHLKHTHGTFYYQRRAPGERPRDPERAS